MQIIELSPSEYKKVVTNPFSKFDTVEFNELNKHKVDEVKYLVFNDGKNRFGLIAGIKNGEFKIPFSAPYSCFTPISQDNKVICYTESCSAMVEYAKKNNLKKIRITLPPIVYMEDHIQKLYNGLYISGFAIKGCDLNFHYNLENFSENYEMNIDQKARQKLRAAIKNNLSFEKTDDIETVYKIIKENRESKNYPLWMTIENIKDTQKIIKVDFFLVYDENRRPVASAIVYYVTVDKLQVIYWGNANDSDNLKPMNFLSFKIFEYYFNNKMKFFDTGPATEFSIPNFGLCDFKQSIGCNISLKVTFELGI